VWVVDTQEFIKTPTLLELLDDIRRDQFFASPVLVAVMSIEPDAAILDEGSLTVQTASREPLDWAKHYAKQYAHNPAYPLDVSGASAGGMLTISIGRSRQSNFRIPDESVSSHHAKLIFDRGRYEYFVVDEHSRNGTHLNGERLKGGIRTQIWSGAYLSFGNSIFVFLDPPTLRKLSAIKG
jgi:hypothetical protein